VQLIKSTENRITARVGERIDIEFDEPGGTGYEWTFEDSPSFEIVADDFREASGDAFGSAGVRTIRLLVRATGNFELRAVLAAPWDADGPERTITIEATS